MHIKANFPHLFDLNDHLFFKMLSVCRHAKTVSA